MMISDLLGTIAFITLVAIFAIKLYNVMSPERIYPWKVGTIAFILSVIAWSVNFLFLNTELTRGFAVVVQLSNMILILVGLLWLIEGFLTMTELSRPKRGGRR